MKRNIEFHLTIKKIRKNLKMTQVNFAKVLGVTQASIARYESGEMLPDITIMLKISEIADCSLEDLLYNFQGNKEKDIRMISLNNDMSEGVLPLEDVLMSSKIVLTLDNKKVSRKELKLAMAAIEVVRDE